MCRLHDRAGPPTCGRGPERGFWLGEAIGRSHGGLTTKIHLACDGQGRPLASINAFHEGQQSGGLSFYPDWPVAGYYDTWVVTTSG